MKIEKKGNIIHKVSMVFVLIFQVIFFILLQVIFIPFAVIGIVDGLYKEVIHTKKYGISFTAVQALQYRWIMHYFESRPDDLSIRFIKKFPCESHFGLWTTLGPLILAQKLTGFKTKLSNLKEPGYETIISTPGRRLIMFDDIMKTHIDNVDQIVMPGSGFDLMTLTHTYGKKVKVYELDQVNTLNLKVDTLDKAGISHDWITYIPVDFSKEQWDELLINAGFDKTKKTLFIWQSVSLYLTEEQVVETIKKMSELSAPGSIVAQDFYSAAFVSGKTSKTAKKTESMMSKNGEPWVFGLDMSNNPNEAVSLFLSKCGLEMTNILQFGEKIKVTPFYCIVEAIKK